MKSPPIVLKAVGNHLLNGSIGKTSSVFSIPRGQNSQEPVSSSTGRSVGEDPDELVGQQRGSPNAFDCSHTEAFGADAAL